MFFIVDPVDSTPNHVFRYVDDPVDYHNSLDYHHSVDNVYSVDNNDSSYYKYSYDYHSNHYSCTGHFRGHRFFGTTNNTIYHLGRNRVII